MSTFLTEDFLLQTEFATTLYHHYAQQQPIIDYHCHLSPEHIAKNYQFKNLTEIWLVGDHYKWRAMRTLGIDEKYITGNAPDEEKFEQWAFTVPYTMRNPLYHWTHLELKRYFGIEKLLSSDSAKEIYRDSTSLLQTSPYSTQSLLKKMKVEVICTTDDPADSLEFHQKLSKNPIGINVLPTFRPDKSYAVENSSTYKAYLEKIGKAANININSFDVLMTALENRIEFFGSIGCKLSDHGLEHLYYPSSKKGYSINELFNKLLKGVELDKSETEFYKYNALIELGRMYHKKGWVQQFHLGALRNTND